MFFHGHYVLEHTFAEPPILCQHDLCNMSVLVFVEYWYSRGACRAMFVATDIGLRDEPAAFEFDAATRDVKQTRND